jgi:hypothetical protein
VQKIQNRRFGNDRGVSTVAAGARLLFLGTRGL